VTFVPMLAEIVTPPDAFPRLVTVPVLLTAVVESVIVPLAALFSRMRFPVPDTPPEAVIADVAAVFRSVVPDELTVRTEPIVRLAVDDARSTSVTLDPIPPDIVIRPEPPPATVTEPILFIEAVEKVTVPVVALLSMRRLFAPVTPPEKVVNMAVPVFLTVNAPDVPVANTIAFEYVSAEEAICNVTASDPVVLPSVILPVPAADALAESWSVPCCTVIPPVKLVFAPERIRVFDPVFTSPAVLVIRAEIVSAEFVETVGVVPFRDNAVPPVIVNATLFDVIRFANMVVPAAIVNVPVTPSNMASSTAGFVVGQVVRVPVLDPSLQKLEDVFQAPLPPMFAVVPFESHQY